MLNQKMIEPRRHELLMELINEFKIITIKELIEKTGVSPATLRRDLAKLEKVNKVERVFGGAKVVNDTSPPYFNKPALNTNETNDPLCSSKIQSVAWEAAMLCSNNDSIVISSSSYADSLIRELARLNLNILTNSVYLASKISCIDNHSLTLSGGDVFGKGGLIINYSSDLTLKVFKSKYIFIGSAGICKNGISQDDPILAHSEHDLLDNDAKLVVMTDASKLHSPSKYIVCDWGRVDTLIISGKPHKDNLAFLKEKGIKLIFSDF